jgi:hypothetical protein
MELKTANEELDYYLKNSDYQRSLFDSNDVDEQLMEKEETIRTLEEKLNESVSLSQTLTAKNTSLVRYILIKLIYIFSKRKLTN